MNKFFVSLYAGLLNDVWFSLNVTPKTKSGYIFDQVLFWLLQKLRGDFVCALDSVDCVEYFCAAKTKCVRNTIKLGSATKCNFFTGHTKIGHTTLNDRNDYGPGSCRC